jgi:hypothetical protein
MIQSNPGELSGGHGQLATVLAPTAPGTPGGQIRPPWLLDKRTAGHQLYDENRTSVTP